jgi:Rrf2 family protein
MFDIAYHGRGGPSKVEHIASREDIPQKYLEQILVRLKKAGLLTSRRGPKGGYCLVDRPDEITIGTVVRAIEGETPHECCYETDQEVIDKCDFTNKCITAAVWRDLATEVNKVLDSATIGDICSRADRFGLGREGDANFVYII